MLKAIIIGNLVSDPELRYSAGGTALLRFQVASNGRTRDADGEWGDRTERVRVTVFGQRAETLSQHLVGGMRVYCDGRLETWPWIDRSNEPRAVLELAADAVELVGGRRRAGDDRRRNRQPVGATGTGDDAYDDLDDLPFSTWE